MHFLGNLSVFLAFGVFLDQVLLGRQGRAQLRSYLRKPPSGEWSTSFIDFLTQADKLVFGRFFSTRFLSKRFMLSSLFLSTGSFLIAVTSQFALYTGDAVTISISKKQIIVILFLFIANVIFDYLSIIQTKVFLDLAILSRSVIKSLLIMFSDLIVKINLFIIAFSAVLLPVIFLFTYVSQEVSVILATTEDSSGKAESAGGHLAQRYLVAPEVAKEIKIASPQIALESEGELNQAYMIIYRSPNMDEAYVISEFLRSVEEVDAVQISATKESASRYAEVLKIEDQVANKIITKVDKIDLLVSLRARSLSDLNRQYTAMFLNVDRIEDAFPASLFANGAFISMDKLIGDAVSALGDLWFLCKDGSYVTSGFAQDGLDLSGCSEVAFINSQSTLQFFESFPAQILTHGRGFSNVWVPYTTLFITSMIPTFFVFVGSLLLAFVIIIWRILRRSANPTAKYIERAPFGITSIIVGGVLLTLGIL